VLECLPGFIPDTISISLLGGITCPKLFIATISIPNIIFECEVAQKSDT